MVKLTSISQKYLEEHKWLAWSTRETTRRALEYLAMATGNPLLDSIEFQHISRFKNWLIETGRSRTSANIYLLALGPVFGWAVKCGLCESNPVDDVRQFKVTQRPIRLYEEWELERMQRISNRMWRGRILLGRFCGLRRGEILNLTKDNVRAGFLFVEPKKDADMTWAWEPKDKEIRKVPVSDELAAFIKSGPCYYPCLSPTRYRTLLRLKAAGMLCERVEKCPDENFNRDFRAIQRRAFGRRIGDFHSLRKTCITHWAEQLPDFFVCKLSGHSKVSTMVTYYVTARQSLWAEARKLSIADSNAGRWFVPAAPQTKELQLGGRGLEPLTPCV